MSASSESATRLADSSREMTALGLLRDGILFAVGLFWSRAMFRRLRGDIDTLRTSRDLRRWTVIGALWGVTAFVVICLISASVGLIRGIAIPT